MPACELPAGREQLFQPAPPIGRIVTDEQAAGFRVVYHGSDPHPRPVGGLGDGVPDRLQGLDHIVARDVGDRLPVQGRCVPVERHPPLRLVLVVAEGCLLHRDNVVHDVEEGLAVHQVFAARQPLPDALGLLPRQHQRHGSRALSVAAQPDLLSVLAASVDKEPLL